MEKFFDPNGDLNLRFSKEDTEGINIEGEKYSLLRAMDVATEENPEFIKAWERKLTNLKFNHIPLEQRIITYHVKRNEEFIAQIPAKVERAREFLAELHEIHMKII